MCFDGRELKQMTSTEKKGVPLRVCHVCSNYDNFYINFMNQQISVGLDIRVFYFRAKERGLPNLDASYLDIRLNYSQWDRAFFYMKERKILDDFLKLYSDDKFDILHAHTLFSNGYIALKVKQKLGIPYIVAVRDMDVNIFFKYRINLRKLGIDVLKEASNIIFISEKYRDQVISKYVPEDLRKEFINKSVVLPNGIDKFYLNNIYVRDVYNLKKKEEINIITVGYVCKRKNQLTVCKAVEMLNAMGIKTKYTIIGKVLDNKVFNKIIKYDFVNYIPFLSKDELIDEYRKADIFVMPSITETFGLTYAEAMSQGLPVIYSKNQGFDGQIEEGKIGFHVDKKNVEDIKNKILRIMSNYEYISKNCTKLVSKFDWVSITNQYIEIYKRTSSDIENNVNESGCLS